MMIAKEGSYWFAVVYPLFSPLADGTGSPNEWSHEYLCWA
jgi:hypothetical protein